MNKLLQSFFVFSICLFLFTSTNNLAQASEGMWQDGGLTALACTNSMPSFTTDGNSGTIVVALQGNSLYAQRIWNGGPFWNPHSGLLVYVGLAPSYIDEPKVVTDNGGGGIIIWKDGKNGINYNIFCQRINNSGHAQWPNSSSPSAIPVRNLTGSTSNVSSLRMIPDGTGGAIIAWLDYRSDSRYDIYVQRVNNNGIAQWTANGVLIYSLSPTIQLYDLELTSDGNNGAIITWKDTRSTTSIYAQRINSAGSIQWATNGVNVATAANNLQEIAIIPDSTGGAILTWQDNRSGNEDIYAQKINSTGISQWTANGVVVCNTSPTNQYNPCLTTDGSDGAIIAWYYQNDTPPYRQLVKAQRLNTSGIPQWTTNGIIVRENAYYNNTPSIVSDMIGGAIITWLDQRPGTPSNNIFAQRINNAGTTLWQTDGIPLTAMGNIFNYSIHSDNNGGAIIGWGVYNNAYVQRILKPYPGITGISTPAVAGTIFHATLTGTDFSDDRGAVNAVKLTRTASTDLIASSLVITNSTSLTCDFDLTSAGIGDWSLVLTDSLLQNSKEAFTVAIVQPTGTPTPSATITLTPTLTPVLTSTPTSTVTATATPEPTAINNFDGQIISKNHIYAAPNPITVDMASIHVYCKQSAETVIKIYTLLSKEVLTINKTLAVGDNIETIDMSSLSNGAYYVFVRAKNDSGLEETAKAKIILLK